MAIPVLRTKLHIPALNRFHIQRARIIKILHASDGEKIILVSAPAGFGKTSLISEWVDQFRDGYPVCWVHLDEGDNEASRFWMYVTAALQTQHENLGEAALSALQALPPAPIEVVLTSLINDIDVLDSDLILVLDDYHAIKNPAIHSAIGDFVENMPGNMRLIISTRIDPPLPIHRWRVGEQMIELRAQDLRFNREETQAYLQGKLAHEFTHDEIEALHKRIDGWIAGLQMAVLSLGGKQDAKEFIRAFSGSHRYIMDYLTEEVFNQQSEEIRGFLLGTCILKRLSGPLCDAVLMRESPHGEWDVSSPAQRMLEQLEQANLFVLPLDDERKWYRYHRLFADLLQQRLRQTRPNDIPGLHQNASNWYAANGYIDEAFTHSLAANDIRTAAQLVENHALELLKVGALGSLSSWLNKLPDEAIRERPWLSVYMSWVLLLTGNYENLDRYLQTADERSSHTQNPNDLRGHISAIRAYATAMVGRAEEALELTTKALDLLPQDNLTVRSVVTFVLGGINMMRGDIPGAIGAMKEASGIGERAGNIHLAVSALNSAGDLLLSQGDLSTARGIYKRALELGTSRSGRPLPITAGIYAGMAEMHLALKDLENARQCAQTGLELASQWGNPENLFGCYLAMAHVAYWEGDLIAAQTALGEAKHLAARHTLSPGSDDRIMAYEALILEGRQDHVLQGTLIESLSERELEVLSLLADGLSNTEIAGELVVAVGTIKAHTSSIYRKLDVRGRTQAVIRARELGLL